MIYKFFDKKGPGGVIRPKPNYQLSNELHRQIIRKFKRRKIYSSLRDNIWGVDMQSLSKYNKGIKCLLCAINVFSKDGWVVPLKDKKGITIDNAFENLLDSSNREPNKKMGWLRWWILQFSF